MAPTIVQVQVVRLGAVVHAVAAYQPDGLRLREMEEGLVGWGAARSELRTVAGESARLYDRRFPPTALPPID